VDRLEKMVRQGTIGVSWVDNRFSLVFEPDEDSTSWLKRTTILIQRDRLTDALEALEVYLNDPFRGAGGFPRSFFDPAHLSSEN